MIHSYKVDLTWAGSTAKGYERYDRTHTVTAPPAEAALDLASDPSFRGDPALWNPEQLVVAAAASCQMLSFLAVAARARITVLSYKDHAIGEMHGTESPMRITMITLRPQIVVTGDVRADRITHLCGVAHRECFIANSLRSEITIEPTVVVADRTEETP